MSERTLLKVTAIIWIAFAAISIFFFDSLPATHDFSSREDTVIPIMAILAGTAMLTTGAVWFFGTRIMIDTDEQPEKAKRNGNLSRIERLTLLMDDDEILELEQMLREREYAALRDN